MIRLRYSIIITAIISVFQISGCATGYTNEMRSVTFNLSMDGPEAAVEEFRRNFTDSTGANRLLYLMELGNLLRLSGSFSAAENLLLSADRLSDQQRGIELDQEIGAFLSNDLALEFRGADYEKVFINYCLAVCYASENNMEDALVECRRVNDKLRALNLRYEENRNRYSDDAFIRYLMGILFEKAGDINNALVAYRNSAAVYDSSYASDYGISLPARVKSDILRLSSELGMQSVFQDYSSQWPDVSWEGEGVDPDNGEVVVILEAGMIPPRIEKSYTFVVDGKVYKVSLPGVAFAGHESWSVVLSSEKYSTDGFFAEDLAGIARKNLEDQAGRDIARAVARLVLKAGVAEAGEDLVENLTEENSGISRLTGFLLSLAGAATEQADLRAWLTLPSRIYVLRLRLPAGEHPVSVTVNGRTVFSDESMDVDPGGINLLFLREG